MVKGVDVGFTKSGQTLILLQDRSKLSQSEIVTRASSTECHRNSALLVIEHRNFGSAPPAPGYIHGAEGEFSSLVSRTWRRRNSDLHVDRKSAGSVECSAVERTLSRVQGFRPIARIVSRPGDCASRSTTQLWTAVKPAASRNPRSSTSENPSQVSA